MPHRALSLLRPEDAVRIYLGMNISRKRYVQGAWSPLVPARTMMEARVFIDDLDGVPCTAKRMIAEVAPSWTSEASARRLLNMMQREGLITVTVNPEDKRANVVQATDALRKRIMSVFASAVAEARRMKGEDIYKQRRVAHG